MTYTSTFINPKRLGVQGGKKKEMHFHPLAASIFQECEYE